MAKRRFTLLFLLNLLICGGLLAHYAADAWCEGGGCVSAEIDTQETILHSGIDMPALPIALPSFTTLLFISLLYLTTWRYTRPPRHRPPVLV